MKKEKKKFLEIQEIIYAILELDFTSATIIITVPTGKLKLLATYHGAKLNLFNISVINIMIFRISFIIYNEI